MAVGDFVNYGAEITYESSDGSVVVVRGNGLIRAHAEEVKFGFYLEGKDMTLEFNSVVLKAK